jgi:hypothetical protein
VQDSRIDDVRSARQAVLAVPEAPGTPSLDAEQVQDFRIDDVRSARQSDVTRLTSNAIKFSDHTTAGGIDSETALMPFAVWASNHPTEKKFLALFPSYVEPVIESDAADGADKATEKPYTEKLYMYVAQARFVLAKAPAEIDLSRYVTLRFLEKIDPAIKHNLISAADAAAFQEQSRTRQRQPGSQMVHRPRNVDLHSIQLQVRGQDPDRDQAGQPIAREQKGRRSPRFSERVGCAHAIRCRSGRLTGINGARHAYYRRAGTKYFLRQSDHEIRKVFRGASNPS